MKTWWAEVATWLGGRCFACDRAAAIGETAIWCSLCAATVEYCERARGAQCGLKVHSTWVYGGAVSDAIVRAKARGGAGSEPLLAASCALLQGGLAGSCQPDADGRIRGESIHATVASDASCDDAQLDDGLDDADVLYVPVAPHRQRWRQRLGHLPDTYAATLARLFPGALGLRILTRTDVAAPRKHGLSPPPSFSAVPVNCDRRVVLVDDVITTGATLCAASAAVRQQGWQVAGAVCLADARP